MAGILAMGRGLTSPRGLGNVPPPSCKGNTSLVGVMSPSSYDRGLQPGGGGVAGAKLLVPPPPAIPSSNDSSDFPRPPRICGQYQTILNYQFNNLLIFQFVLFNQTLDMSPIQT